jgi:hypothetical protein
MLQFINRPDSAAKSYAELESAMPVTVSAEDAMSIEEDRRQYHLLGTHLPTLSPMAFLASAGAPAPSDLNTSFAGATVFLLFPDWCNQCVVMGSNSKSKTQKLIDTYHVRIYELLAQASSPEKRAESEVKNVPLPAKLGKAAQDRGERLHVDQQLAFKSTPDELLLGSPTIVVPNETLDAFAATDFPLIVATDSSGLIRVVQLAPENALDPDGDVDQIVQHILATWPPH